ncbi:hypothetical protein AM334_16160 [Klebsiella aerogenes]|nr:hypothetical protein AM334_16160 [Klebsiella aerogenes]SFX84862.1 hypothetical protein SAMN03097705_0082 [[Enterobacter] aerogenes] [Klebsiella aerogenes]
MYVNSTNNIFTNRQNVSRHIISEIILRVYEYKNFKMMSFGRFWDSIVASCRHNYWPSDDNFNIKIIMILFHFTIPTGTENHIVLHVFHLIKVMGDNIPDVTFGFKNFFTI